MRGHGDARPRSPEEWGPGHDGAFRLATALGASALFSFATVAAKGWPVGALVGLVVIAGRRPGRLPTRLLVVAAGIGIASTLAFVAFLLYRLFFGGLCC
jgi:hypothetical protein